MLNGTGVNQATIKAAGLGWNERDTWERREAWGLPPDQREDGRPRLVWLPGGLVIPHLDGGRVVRLRVRSPDPGGGPRYVVITGSGSKPMTWGTEETRVLVESEIDGLLIHQEAGDLIGVIALGSAQARPDVETDRALKEAGLILVALDSDQAGAKESWQWWAKHYPNAKRWPVVMGKDPTEAAHAGLDLRAWVLAGLPIKPETEEPITAPAQEQATAHQEGTGATKKEKTYQSKGADRRTDFKPFSEGWKNRFDEGTLERLAVMTVDGGLTDLDSLEVVSRC